MIRAMAFTTLALLALGLMAACGGATEEGQTPTPPGGAGSELGPATVVPPPTVSPEPIPADWATYTNSQLGITFRYPSTWYLGPGSATISSWDYTTWDKPYYPPNGFRLQFDLVPIDEAESRPPEATDITLGGVAGWQIAYSYDPAKSGGITRVHQVAAERNGYRFFFVAREPGRDHLHTDSE